MKNMLVASILVIVIFYVGLLALLFFFQNSLIFFPKKLPRDFQFEFKNTEEKYLELNSRERVNYLVFKSAESKGKVLYFHGNAGALDTWGYVAEELVRKLGYEVWIVDYQGYGKSTKHLPRTGKELIDMGDRLLKTMKSELDPSHKLVVYGRSLGSGVATGVASRNKVDALILETPYVSTLRMARRMFPFIPSFLLRIRLDNQSLNRLKTDRVLLIHGTRDSIIPVSHSKELSASYPQKTEALIIEGGGHNDLSNYEEYWRGLEKYLDSIEKQGL